MDIKKYLSDKKKIIDNRLKDLFIKISENIPSILADSIKYSLFAGGKRIRPILTYTACDSLSGDCSDAITVGAAIEFIHTYSLIHDDLPAMDDDDYRRGKLTNHKVFGEGIAILAGDALLTEAFNILTDRSLYCSIDLDTIIDITNFISSASGSFGMVGGQVYDLIFENKEITFDELNKIHNNKTGKLLTASVYAGARIATSDFNILKSFIKYGQNIGLVFQIIDDILDVTGTFENLGKSAGSDIKKNKATYPALVGLDKSKKIANNLTEEAIEIIAFLEEKGETLKELATFMLNRIQ